MAGHASARCLHHLFEAQVARTPDAIALIQEGEEPLTYLEVNERANRLAHYLQSRGVGLESLVGLYMARSIGAIVGVLAILKAGGAYVPLDPAYPAERIAFMIEDARLALILSHSSLPEPPLATKRIQPEFVALDRLSSELAHRPRENPANRTAPDNLAYVIYTSGSTGRPKGVLGLHRGMANFLNWIWQAYPFAANDVCCQKTSLNFVDSIWEIFWPLGQGVPLVLIEDHVLKSSVELLRALETHQVTRLVVVPSLLRTLLHRDLQTERSVGGTPLRHRLSSLRFWVTSGEALSVALCRRFHEALPDATLLNLYGSSEVSANASWYDTRAFADTSPSVPIGQALDNTTLYILDSERRALPVGVAGELHVGGEGLARGYLHRPELTESHFIANPFGEGRLYKTGDRARLVSTPRGESLIEILGRIDHQVKIRGMRVELPEIEATLMQHSSVHECVVTFTPDRAGSQLVAYVVARVDEALPKPSIQLRAFLRARLPEHMVPTGFVLLDALPLTPNGKVDRLALPAYHDEPTLPYVAPQTEIERRVSEIWRGVLGVARIGVHENFADAGGDSLRLIDLQTRLSSAFETSLSLTDLLHFPTIAAQAEVLAGAETQPLTELEIVPLQGVDLYATAQRVAEVFVERGVTVSAAGITYDDYLPFAMRVCGQAVKDGLSLIAKAKKTGDVVGFSICEDYGAERREALDAIAEHPKWRPLSALLAELGAQFEAGYPELQRGDLLHILLSGSHIDHPGVGSLLLQATSKMAQEKNYEGIVSKDSMRMMQELSALEGFECVAEIDYQSFVYQGATPFAKITDAPSCKLMLKRLTVNSKRQRG